MAFVLDPLPYATDALEPYIDAATMEIHHGRHHNAYITNLNNALAGSAHEGSTLEQLVATAGAISPAVRNNAGGHWNHRFFWNILAPHTGSAPTGALGEAISATFGSIDAFKDEFKKACLGRFGSGWAWLIQKADGSIAICSSPNQDNPLMDIAETKGTPLLGLDLWEHAYYLKYQNKRPDYVDAFWNVVNWDAVAQNYKA
jgi:superoxide dismutase, Fe-Mn family